MRPFSCQLFCVFDRSTLVQLFNSDGHFGVSSFSGAHKVIVGTLLILRGASLMSAVRVVKYLNL